MSTAITYDPNVGWRFTLGKQDYFGFDTKEEAQAALYDAERGLPPAWMQPDDAEEEIIRTIDRVLSAEDERIAIAREIDRILEQDDPQPDPNSIPEAVAAITYGPFGAACASIEALDLPEPLRRAVLDQVAELTDHLTSPTTVAKLVSAWLTA